MSEKEHAFKWFQLGYTDRETQYEESDSWSTEEDIRNEFEMYWEYQGEDREMEANKE